MGSIQEEGRRARLAKIVEICDESPKTVIEISNILNVSYHTARKDIIELTEAEMLSVAVGANKGKTAFTTGVNRRHVPMILVEASGQYVPIFTISDAYLAAVESGGNRTTEAVVGVLKVAADLMHKTYFMSQGGDIEPKHLAELRRELIEHKKYLDSTSNIAEQMLNTYILWDPEPLSKVILDNEWDPQRMEDNYQKALEITS